MLILVANGAKCPYCAGRYVLSGYNDFETIHPEFLLEWDYQKNDPVLPSQLLHSSNKKVWYKHVALQVGPAILLNFATFALALV